MGLLTVKAVGRKQRKICPKTSVIAMPIKVVLGN